MDNNLVDLCKKVRRGIMISTTAAQSGHPTTSLSAVELLVGLFFGGNLRYDLAQPQNFYNDRVIFSKGHASPLLYSLYYAAGVVSEAELRSLRQIDSVLEGHPTPRFKYVDVATGSLGQGLSLGLGMALGIKLRNKREVAKANLAPRAEGVKREQRVYVLLGDSESAEGQLWEALQLAAFHKVNNLIGILDVNRLGQSRETMLEWDLETYKQRISAFGWNTIVLEDGNDLEEVEHAYSIVDQISAGSLTKRYSAEKSTLIIAKTIKGKGLKRWENRNGFHAKQVKPEELPAALAEIGSVPDDLKGEITKPEKLRLISDFNIPTETQPELPEYQIGTTVTTKEASGDILLALGKVNPNIVVLDGEVSNSTHTNKFRAAFPDRFFEMFIAEQNMVSTAVGISKMGFIPYVATFSSFFSRAFDQLRMAQYSNANIKLLSSYAGVSAGMDGPSGMGLEDLAWSRSLLNSVVLSVADAVSAAKVTNEMYKHEGISYLRLLREKTPVIYAATDDFKIGGAHVLRSGPDDKVTIVTTGICVHEALKAQAQLEKDSIHVSVIDAYSVKPLDRETIVKELQKNNKLLVVEDHHPCGGLGEAVASTIIGLPVKLIHLADYKIARSGKPSDTLRFEGLDAEAIITSVKSML